MRSRREWGSRWMIGVLLFLSIWQTIGGLRLAGPSVPAPSEVWAVYAEPWKLALLCRAAGATLLSAAIGLGVGCVFGVAVAIVAHLFAPMRRGLDQLSVVVNAVPAIALGPILIVTVGREGTPATLASIPVFFTMYVSCSSGLRLASPHLTDAFAVLGASRFARLLYLEGPAALPGLLNGMQIGITAAIVGAIVGEWFGATSGLGIVILNTMLNFQIPLMWAAVLMTASISLIAYRLIGACAECVRGRFA